MPEATPTDLPCPRLNSAGARRTGDYARDRTRCNLSQRDPRELQNAREGGVMSGLSEQDGVLGRCSVSSVRRRQD